MFFASFSEEQKFYLILRENSFISLLKYVAALINNITEKRMYNEFFTSRIG